MKNDFVFYTSTPLLVQSNNYHAANREDEKRKVEWVDLYYVTIEQWEEKKNQMRPKYWINNVR